MILGPKSERNKNFKAVKIYPISKGLAMSTNLCTTETFEVGSTPNKTVTPDNYKDKTIFTQIPLFQGFLQRQRDKDVSQSKAYHKSLNVINGCGQSGEYISV